jgi:RNA polymerase sigma-70 factor (ECF subfamily)
VDPDAERSDELLWADARSGDGSAFGVIYDRHVDRVYTQCIRRLASREDAQDVVSGVFTEAWRAREKVRFVDGSCLPWLLVVAVHLCSNHARTARRYERHLRRVPPDMASPDPADDVADRVDRGRQAQALAAAISKLSVAEQQVVSLCDLSEVTYQTAAQALAIPIGTVRSRLSRAHEKLRTSLRRAELSGPVPPTSAASMHPGGKHA